MTCIDVAEMIELPSGMQQGGERRAPENRVFDDSVDDADEFLEGIVNEVTAFQDLLASVTMFKKYHCDDFEHFLRWRLRSRLCTQIQKKVQLHHGVKVQLVVSTVYVKVKQPEKEPIIGHLRSRFHAIFHKHQLFDIVKSLFKDVREKHLNFIRDASGLRFNGIHGVAAYFAKHTPLAGSAYVELPPFLGSKKAIVNVKNTDNRCFGYALLSALHPQALHVDRASKYDPLFHQHENIASLNYPVMIEDLPEVERTLQIPINVYSFFDDEGQGRYPVYLSRIDSNNGYDLLYWDKHFAWIKNFSRFLGDCTKHNGKKWFCKRCLGHFSEQRVLAEHQENCLGDEGSKLVYTMPEKGTILEFKNVRAQQKLPFIIYADFECLTEKLQSDDEDGEPLRKRMRTLSAIEHDHAYCQKRDGKKHIEAYQQHTPISVGLKLVSNVTDAVESLPYETYTGEDVCDWFLHKLLQYEETCLRYLFDEKRLIMTDDDLSAHFSAAECYMCKAPFQNNPTHKGRVKVRDHDHITGKYRGAAHSSCNLMMRRTYKIPIIFHNFRGYDSHLLIRDLGKFKDKELNIIGQGLEKYLSIMWGNHLVFRDSLQFLNASLEKLAGSLFRTGRDNFKHLLHEFRSLGEAQLGLLFQKGIYPYDYMNDAVRLNENRLPSRNDFANRLRQQECSALDYAQAQLVWKAFNCQSFLDYHNLYLKCDVLLLADVFESFRTVSMTNYDLDPAHFVSAPSLSWDAMMKMTKCQQELLSDPAMFDILQKGLRGGVSMISKRYAKANNKYMGSLHDATQPTSYILYLDANNLYGWSMSESLPTKDFTWLTENEWNGIDWLAQADDQELGYFIECDLNYPRELHDLHNDYPLAAEKLEVKETMLSEGQHALREKYAMSHALSTKLIPNLINKTKYICHYRNLRFYLEHGLVLHKIHRVIRFRQRKWLAPYIEKNSALRATSTSSFEKDFFKLLNNSVYGKTCENLTKRSDIRLITDQKKCSKLVRKPHCLGFRIFSEDIAAVEMRKLRCLINKPTYVGFAVLELSKLLMYHFHYDFMLQRYPNNAASMLFTDTDSLVYHIQTDDLYADLAEHAEHFDFSNYANDHPLHSGTNKMVVGKMKDEAAGKIITEFVGLRPKMYSYLKLEDSEARPEPTYKEEKRVKGVQRCAAERLQHANFLAQLRDPVENYICVRRIGQQHHWLYTLEGDKRALCAFDDKRYLLPDNISSLAHGHYRIPLPEDVPIDDLEAESLANNNTPRPETTDASRATTVTDDDQDQITIVSQQEARVKHCEPKFDKSARAELFDLTLTMQDPRTAFDTIRRSRRNSQSHTRDSATHYDSLDDMLDRTPATCMF